MRANGRKGKQLVAPANDEKPLVTKVAIDSIGRVVSHRPGIDHMFLAGGRTAVHRLAPGDHARTQQQKFPAGQIHGFLIFKYQAGDNAVVNFRPRMVVHREDKAKTEPWLHLAHRFEIEAKTGVSDQAGLAGISLV